MENNVKQLYTSYPYPKYDPELDKYAPKKVNGCGYNLNINEINHNIYKGKQKNFDNFKVLIAGVGIGTNLICIAKNFESWKNTKIVGIDISPKSLEICKQRVKKYGLKNIKLIEMSLLDLNQQVYGIFDMIICVGVLHHLENPALGLKTLYSVLKDDGHMELMLYGKIGRTGVYHMQNLLKIINKDVDNYEQKIANFKKIYKYLPKENWFKKSENFICDHNKSEAGIVDLLLHCQDRAYNIDEVYNLVESCDLRIIDFMYDIKNYLEFKIPGFDYLTKREQYRVNELFFGNICKYCFYVCKKDNTDTIAKIQNLDNILIINNHLFNSTEIIKTIIKQKPVKYPEIRIIKYKIKNANIHLEFFINANDIIIEILKAIDGKKTIKNIFDQVKKSLDYKLSNNQLLTLFEPVYKVLENLFIVLLTV